MAAIIAIELVAGGAAEHVTVLSSNAAVSPSNVSWVLDANLNALSVTPDATGFNFAAPVGMPPTAGNAVATDITNGATSEIPIVVSINALTFQSP